MREFELLGLSVSLVIPSCATSQSFALADFARCTELLHRRAFLEAIGRYDAA